MAAVALVMVTAGRAPAQDDSADTVRKLINDLVSDPLEARQAAQQRLREIAPQVLPALKKRAESKDQVVRSRVGSLVKEIETQDIPRLIAQLTDVLEERIKHDINSQHIHAGESEMRPTYSPRTRD